MTNWWDKEPAEEEESPEEAAQPISAVPAERPAPPPWAQPPTPAGYAVPASYLPTPEAPAEAPEPELVPDPEAVADEVVAEGDENIDEVIEEADDDDDEIVFDLASLSVEERRHLSMRLTGAGIAYLWEVGSDLVVSVADAPVIESYVDEVRNPDAFGDDELVAFEGDDDIDDEAVYAAMSNLYVAADKLMQRPGDEPTAGTFYLAADDVDGLPAPFGFDPRVWTQVQSLTASILSALDAEGDVEAIGTDARSLRQLLVNYV